MPRPTRYLSGAILCATFAFSACSPRPPGDPTPDTGGHLITSEQIARTGAQNAWEALLRSGAHFTETPRQRNANTISTRGSSSLFLSAEPMIVVDGAQMRDASSLRSIPAWTIARIRTFGGIEGTKYFGTGGGNGVVVIETRRGEES